MFNIRQLNSHSKSIAIVTAISYENPLSSLSEIEQELVCLLGKKVDGEVIFDLVCSNGLEWNRFLSLQLKNGSFDYNSASVLNNTELPSQLMDEQVSFLSKNPDYLKNSVLTPDEIQQLVSI